MKPAISTTARATQRRGSAEQQQGGRRGVGVGRHPAQGLLGPQVGDHRLPGPVGPAAPVGQHRPVPPQQLGVGEQRGSERQDVPVEPQGPAGQVGQVALDRAPASPRRQVPDHLDEGGQGLLVDGPDQVELVGEVQVQGALGAAGLPGDLLGGRPGQALGAQDTLGGVDQLVAGASGPGRGE
jgi:hypothetical protein